VIKGTLARDRDHKKVKVGEDILGFNSTVTRGDWWLSYK